MEESIICECGRNNFWWLGDYLRCPNCYNEYKQVTQNELLFRRFNKEENNYPELWEIFNTIDSII